MHNSLITLFVNSECHDYNRIGSSLKAAIVFQAEYPGRQGLLQISQRVRGETGAQTDRGLCHW